MARPRAPRRVRAHQTHALVLQRVEFGESDLIVTLMTERIGRVSALARGARRSRKRFGGTLEPIHTLSVRLDERMGSDLYTLRESTIERPRRRITTNLDLMQAAGRALGWLRKAATQHSGEPGVWHAINRLLDRLETTPEDRGPQLFLAEFGLQLLSELGFGIDFGRCIRCGKAAPAGQAALVDAARGGLVCRACGGARTRLTGALRERLAQASHGELGVLKDEEGSRALELVEQALRAHMGLE